MITHYVGIDPGITGAVCVMTADGEVHAMHDVPVLAEGKGHSRTKRAVDALGLCEIIRPYAGRARAAMERNGPRPNSTLSTYGSYRDTVGVIRGVLSAYAIPVHWYAPQDWKGELALPAQNDESKASYAKKKELARALAIELYPGQYDWLKRKSDHDRAEALLIARVLWLRNTRKVVTA